MGFGLFGKKKGKKEKTQNQIAIDQFLEDLMDIEEPQEEEEENEMPAQVQGETTKREKRKEIEHYIIAQCESIIENTREMESWKIEYKNVSQRLEDIRMLEELEEKQKGEIKDTVHHLIRLNAVRDGFHNTEKKLNDAQFAQFQLLEEDVPDEINRLKANESYQSAIKRDMQYIEGEKQELTIRHEQLESEQGNLQKMLMYLLGIAGLAFVFFFLLASAFRVDVRDGLLWCVIAIGAVTLGLFSKRQWNVSTLHRIEVNKNHAIQMENKMKIKYVNVTNAIDYICEKYHVRNSYELNQEWEKYMDMVKERQKYMQTNEELEYYNQKFTRLIRDLDLFDEKVWMGRMEILVNEEEFAKRKEELLVRHKKLKKRLDYNMTVIRKAQKEVDYLSAKMKNCSENIKEIVTSVDQLCAGLLQMS